MLKYNFMIQQQTILQVADNSGAKKVKCIKVIGGLKKKISFLGDVIRVSVKELRNKSKITSKVRKGEVLKGIIVRTKKNINKKDGVFFSFFENAVVLLNNQNKLLGTRILGPLPKQLRKNKFLKLASISTGFF